MLIRRFFSFPLRSSFLHQGFSLQVSSIPLYLQDFLKFLIDLFSSVPLTFSSTRLTLPLHSDASNSTKDSPLQIQSTPTSERAHSVVFLLHGGQPLSYIASLIRAEAPSPQPGASQSLSQDSLPSPSSNDSAISSSNGEVQNSPESVFVDSSDSSSQSSPSPESPPSPGPISKKKINDGAKQSWETQAYADESKDREDEEMDYRRSSSPALGTPPITFHTKSGDGKRWSPSTGIGDFLRDAAR